jgi:RNA polymerase sigma factor (TIGR02999 family)
MDRQANQITTLLVEWRRGNRDAGDALIALVYPRLKRLAAGCLRRQRPDAMLQPTALVHELYMSLFGTEPITLNDRTHFFAVAAQQLRRILLDHTRAARAQKRGGGQLRVTLPDLLEAPGADRCIDDLIVLDEALTELANVDPRAAQVVEHRFFGGLNEKESAELLSISVATVKRDWDFAKAWLSRRLAPSDRADAAKRI